VPESCVNTRCFDFPTSGPWYQREMPSFAAAGIVDGNVPDWKSVRLNTSILVFHRDNV